VLGLVIKSIVSDISVAAFLLTIPVLAFEGYKLYLEVRQPDPIKINEEVVKELENIKSKLNAQTLEKGVKPPVSRYF
jgi:hypothetical protein